MKSSLSESRFQEKYRPKSSINNKSLISDSLKNLKPLKISINQFKNKDPFKQMMDSKQNLRELITDFVLNRMIKQKGPTSANRTSGFGKKQKLKYIQIKTYLQINGVEREISFSFKSILEQYLQLEQKNIYKHQNIEPLIVDILNFLDKMDQLLKQMTFDFPSQFDFQKEKQRILAGLIDIYHRKNKTIHRLRQLNDQKIKTIARFTRVSYLDIQNQAKKKQCEYLIEKSALTNQTKAKRWNHTKQKVCNVNHNQNSKLKDLIDNGKNIFANGDKIEQIRRQKLKNFYKINVDTFNNKHKKAKLQSNLFFGNIYDQNQNFGQQSFEIVKFLEEWVAEINLSEALYFQKFCNRRLNRGNPAGTNKIINRTEQPNQYDPIQQQNERSQDSRSSQTGSKSCSDSQIEFDSEAHNPSYKNKRQIQQSFGRSTQSLGLISGISLNNLKRGQIDFAKPRVSIGKTY